MTAFSRKSEKFLFWRRDSWKKAEIRCVFEKIAKENPKAGVIFGAWGKELIRMDYLALASMRVQHVFRPISVLLVHILRNRSVDEIIDDGVTNTSDITNYSTDCPFILLCRS